MIKILAADDEEPLRRLLKKELTRKGFFVEVVPDGKTALSLAGQNTYDVLLLDIMMPGLDGIEVMKKLKTDPSAPVIIVLTGKATIETAVEAMKYGAYDYLTKPYKLDELVIVISRAYEFGRLRIKTQLLEQELVRKETPFKFISSSRQMKEIHDLIRKIAPTDSPVFIQGESGTGKELVANTIWHYSKRSAVPIIALNCATFSENLIESEVFGHEKGAFTNAYETKHGIVEVADQGTLFLDEIAEMPIGLQAKLLRFLDTGEFRRVGGNKIMNVDVRVIAATNKDLLELIHQGIFREDLYYRLNVINITIPPLRERPEEIEELAGFFAQKYSQKLSKTICGFTPEALGALSRYTWPGNVRELENVVERAVILCDSDHIGIKNLSLPAVEDAVARGAAGSLEKVERDYILRVLREYQGNQSKTSLVLGIDRKTLYLKLKKYGLSDYLKK